MSRNLPNPSPARGMSQDVILESSAYVSEQRIVREAAKASILETEAAIRVLERKVDDMQRIVNWCDRIISEAEAPPTL